MICNLKDCPQSGGDLCGNFVYQKLSEPTDMIPLLNCVRHTNGVVSRLVNSWELYTHLACKGLQVPALYMMDGHAPSYTNPLLGGKFKDVHMHWTRARVHPLLIDYNEVFGTTDYSMNNVQAVNQLFLREEADMWLTWMNRIYPEENTKMYQVKYPVSTDVKYVPLGCITKEGGAFFAFDVRWTHDWLVTYWCITKDCELLQPTDSDEDTVQKV